MSDEPQRRMDEYGPDDMAVPAWNLLQKTGGDWAKTLGAKPGQFHNNSSDEIADELNIVVADIRTGRARWGPEISDAGPLCASQEAKGNLSLNGDDCSECPYRLDTPWSADAAERRTMCCLNYVILGFDIDNYMPCIIRAHGISALPVRQLITQLRMNHSLRGEYHRAVVNIKSQEKTTRYGISYALHPRITELITNEDKAKELKVESDRLLGAPIPLLESRPEEEPEPIGFTPEGIPFYSEAEKDRLLAKEAAEIAEATAEPAAAVAEKEEAETPPAGETTKPPEKLKAPAAKEEKKEPTEENLDLDF